MQDFQRLIVWRRAHRLTLSVYRTTQDFPRREYAGLTAQIRRAAISVSANIAEGCCREGKRDFARFLQMALASAAEVEYHVLLAHDLGLMPRAPYAALRDDVISVKRMLAALIVRVRSEPSIVSAD